MSPKIPEENQEDKFKGYLSDENKKNHIKFVFQDCNINFLIGSGLSTPFFGTLGKIEEWLTDLEESKDLLISDEQYKFIKASLYNAYFEVAMQGSLDILNFDVDVTEYLEIYDTDTPDDENFKKLNNTFLSYKDFLNTLNHILYERRSNTVSKQVNLFTTNIDIFLEKTLEHLDLHFNDGFNGIFKKKFSLSNFKKSFYQKSLQYDNISEIPVFNLLKVHGSVTWKMISENIQFSRLGYVKRIAELKEKGEFELIEIIKRNYEKWENDKEDLTLNDIIGLAEGFDDIPDLSKFLRLYEKLQIINPTKEKFKDTTFNKTYYELLRLYANELEKENTVLFVMGFSMADEHIREITIRALKSNPTLKVFFVAFKENDTEKLNDYLENRSYHNLEILAPEEFFGLQKFNNQILIPLLEEVRKSNNRKKY
ncbi:MAG: SIR2 family protein [Cyclobacteriaceae bacterium]|nr:SIR2 family protein [Cyclobacteriaceae bacterium]